MKPPPKNRRKKHKTIASLECRSLFRPEGGDSQLDSSRFICKVYLHSASQAGKRMPAHTQTHAHAHTHAHYTLSFTPLEATVRSVRAHLVCLA